MLVGFHEGVGWWRAVSLPGNIAQHKMPVSISHSNGKHVCFLTPILFLLNKWDSHTCSRLELIVLDSYSAVNPCGIIISWTSAFCVMHYYCFLRNTCSIHFSYMPDNTTLRRIWKINEVANHCENIILLISSFCDENRGIFAVPQKGNTFLSSNALMIQIRWIANTGLEFCLPTYYI